MIDYDQHFKNNLPETLYLSHYELSNMFPNTTPNAWRQYLKDQEHFITSETAAIAEANARSALSKLGSGASSQEVSSIKALLEKSKLINDAQKQQQHVMLTFIPSKDQVNLETVVKVLKHENTVLKEYTNYIAYLAESNRFNRNTHTLEWFKEYRKESR